VSKQNKFNKKATNEFDKISKAAFKAIDKSGYDGSSPVPLVGIIVTLCDVLVDDGWTPSDVAQMLNKIAFSFVGPNENSSEDDEDEMAYQRLNDEVIRMANESVDLKKGVLEIDWDYFGLAFHKMCCFKAGHLDEEFRVISSNREHLDKIFQEVDRSVASFKSPADKTKEAMGNLDLFMRVLASNDVTKEFDASAIKSIKIRKVA
jgi:hypothetical protein